MDLTIAWASTEDQDWVDAQYESIKFLPSDLTQDRVAIAYWQNQRVGLGRLVPLTAPNWELGGMFVHPDFRKRGIARALVEYLLAAAPTQSTLYCVPFRHLTTFYESCGFRPVTAVERKKAPRPILDKCNWCNSNFDQQAGLLVYLL